MQRPSRRSCGAVAYPPVNRDAKRETSRFPCALWQRTVFPASDDDMSKRPAGRTADVDALRHCPGSVTVGYVDLHAPPAPPTDQAGRRNSPRAGTGSDPLVIAMPLPVGHRPIERCLFHPKEVGVVVDDIISKGRPCEATRIKTRDGLRQCSW